MPKQIPPQKITEFKHIEAFVIGNYVLHMEGRPAYKDTPGNRYPYDEPYFRDCLAKTDSYLKGRQKLDASCSDFQCYLATEAAKVFGKKE